MLLVCTAHNMHASAATGSSVGLYMPSSQNNPSPLKPVAVVYFTGEGSHSGEYVNSIKAKITESQREFGLSIHEYAVDDESKLPSIIDQIADGETGFIAIIEPRKPEALIKIPSLYPDIQFSVIGLQEPLYIINVNSILFKEQEGAFISGALAALQSGNGIVSFISKEDAPYSRNLAYAYYQGAKYINPSIQVLQQLGTRHMFGNSALSPAAQKSLTQGKHADIAFVLDDELLDATIRQAKEQKQLVIAPNTQALETHQGSVLTGLLKHYDLALYAALRSYATHSWTPAAQNLGIGDGYIDYVVDHRNRSFFSKESIERTERTKDLVAQGIITISPLSQ